MNYFLPIPYLSEQKKINRKQHIIKRLEPLYQPFQTIMILIARKPLVPQAILSIYLSLKRTYVLDMLFSFGKCLV